MLPDIHAREGLPLFVHLSPRSFSVRRRVGVDWPDYLAVADGRRAPLRGRAEPGAAFWEAAMTDPLTILEGPDGRGDPVVVAHPGRDFSVDIGPTAAKLSLGGILATVLGYGALALSPEVSGWLIAATIAPGVLGSLAFGSAVLPDFSSPTRRLSRAQRRRAAELVVDSVRSALQLAMPQAPESLIDRTCRQLFARPQVGELPQGVRVSDVGGLAIGSAIVVSVDPDVWPAPVAGEAQRVRLRQWSPGTAASGAEVIERLRAHLDALDLILGDELADWTLIRDDQAGRLITMLAQVDELAASSAAVAQERAAPRLVKLSEQANLLMAAADQLAVSHLDAQERQIDAAGRSLER